MKKITQKKYLVFGAGLSGRSAYKLLKHKGYAASLIEGDGPEDISSFSTMVLSPGISRDHPLVQSFLKEKKEVIGEIELASQFITTPIIAMTGSNGKTTVCMMIAEFLKSLGKKVFLGGNIGIPLSEGAYLESLGESFDYMVCEVSSFQLESLKSFRPLISGVLNLEFTHQERYQSFQDYVRAKSHIADYQSDKETFFLCESKELERELRGSLVHKILWSENPHYGFEFMKLVGEHNKKNFQHCFQVVKKLGVSFTPKEASNFISRFTGADFRVQRVGQKGSFIFYNDAKSTNLSSVITALDCFKDKDILLICGGKKRSFHIKEFEKIKQYSQVKKVYTIGESGEELASLLSGIYTETLDQAFLKIVEMIKKKQISNPIHVVFSPGFPSFDHYENYQVRGRHFNELVETL